MVIPRRRPSSLLLGYAWNSRSGSHGIPARFAVDSTLALLWNPCSVCRGISVRFGVEYAGRYPDIFRRAIDGLPFGNGANQQSGLFAQKRLNGPLSADGIRGTGLCANDSEFLWRLE